MSAVDRRDPNDPDYEPDPPEFRRDLVPYGSPWADVFFDGRSGRGLTDEEYNETARRYPDWPFGKGGSHAGS